MKRTFGATVALLATVGSAHLIAAAPPPSALNLSVDGIGNVSAPLQIVVLLTLITFVPAALVIMTSFTRIAIVFHFLRQALGSQDMPSNQMLVGLTLFLTAFIMAPVADRINQAAVQPALAGQIDITQAIERGSPPLREFMLKQTRQHDLALFVDIAKLPRPDTPDDVPMRAVIPAYAISELKTGFQMGFFLFIPFPAHRPRRLHDAAVDGHAAAAARDDLAAVQDPAVRDDRRLEPAGGVAGSQLSVTRGTVEAQACPRHW